ncbi:MAG TPA: 30S ribosome-binding factor RbfA [Actinomycetota bacterium]|nr:30S ribosome-binding factor RbfA [Actinomycetota bacterium]
MPKNYPRSERVERLAKEVLGEAIQELKDPRVGFTTVTAVKLSPDMRHARVFVSALGTDEEREATMEGLQRAAPHLRSVLAHEVRLRKMPQIEIVEDKTAEQGDRLERLLRGLGVSQPPEVEKLEDPEEEQQ